MSLSDAACSSTPISFPEAAEALGEASNEVLISWVLAISSSSATFLSGTAWHLLPLSHEGLESMDNLLCDFSYAPAPL